MAFWDMDIGRLPTRDVYYRCPYCQRPYCAPFITNHVLTSHPVEASMFDYYAFIRSNEMLPSLHEMFGHLFKVQP